MSSKISLNDVWNGEYLTVVENNECKMALNINPYSFGKYLQDLFREVPNDFRDVVHAYLIDCAIKYFETHPISEEERERFFELLGKLEGYDYEEDKDEEDEE